MNEDNAPSTRDPGQGLVETAVIVVLVLVDVVAILVLLGPPILLQLSHTIGRS